MPLQKYVNRGFLITHQNILSELSDNASIPVKALHSLQFAEWNILLFGKKDYAYSIVEQEDLTIIEIGNILNKERDAKFESIEKYEGYNIIILFYKKANTFRIFRDRLGINEIFYDTKCTFFTNILHLALLIRNKTGINHEKLLEYIVYRHTSGKETIYKDLHEIEPGHFFEVANRHISLQKYFELEFAEDEDERYEYWREKTIEILKENLDQLAYGYDIFETGMLLSRGVDSNILKGLIGNEDMLYIMGDFRESGYEESNICDAWGGRNRRGLCVKLITYDEYYKNIEKTIEEYAMPLNAPNMVSYSILYQGSVNKGIKCLISGEGADALFGGISFFKILPIFRIPKILRKLFANGLNYLPETLDQRFLYGKKEKLLGILNRDFSEALLSMHAYSETDKVKKLIKGHGQIMARNKLSDILSPTIDMSQVNKYHIALAMAEDPKVMLRIARSNGVELHFPYLLGNTVTLIRKMPMKYKYRKRTTKYILKDICTDFIPAEYVYSRKSGFGVPLEKWMYNKEWYEDILENVFEERHNEFDHKQMNILKGNFVNKQINNYEYEGLIWTLYNYCLWKKMYQP